MNEPGQPGWRPTASRQAIERRAQLLQDIRDYFARRNVIEIETPILSAAGNTDPNIVSLELASSPPAWLRTSPEYALKRLLASGLGDCYELGRVFRANERGRLHNPEFTLLEWYRRGLGYHELAAEVLDLVRACGRGHFDSWPLQQVSYRDWFMNELGLDPWLADAHHCEELAREHGLQAPQLDRLGWLDLLVTHLLQPRLDAHSLTVVFDFLPEQAALARIRNDQRPVAERFEVFLGQAELANGYQELTDPEEQRRRFESEQKTRQRQGEPTPPLDKKLLAALQHGLPECSGVALGVDRLLMGILEVADIRSVIAFPA